MMSIRLIKSEYDYEASLIELDRLMDASPGSDQFDELEVLSILISDYEAKSDPIGVGDPIESIRFRMEQQELTQSDMVQYIGSRSKVSEVLNRKRPLSLSMIRKLHKGLGIPAEVLLAEPRVDSPSEVENIEWTKFPVREMAKRGWFPDYKQPSSRIMDHAEELVRGLFGRAGEFSPALNRQSELSGTTANPYAVVAWHARILAKARQEQLPPYNRGRISNDFLSDLVKFSTLPNGPYVAVEHLNTYGIHIVLEPHLPRTYLDGAAMLMDDCSPVVGLTIRHDRVDNFWFTLTHELAHIGLHIESGKHQYFLENLDEPENNDFESEANDFASNALIPSERWKAVSPIAYLKTQDVHKLARRFGVHPAIVAGRIRRETSNYKKFSRMLGNRQVRKHFKEFL